CVVNLCYEVSGRSFGYRYENLGDAVRLNLKCGPCLLNLHLLVPKGKTASRLSVDGREVKFQRVAVEESQFVDAALPVAGAEEILLRLEVARHRA
ncbi:MAG: hypothetical protein H5U38_13335, partial [Calditrichaeota bacterium]|nr:hypothetical protein [Calditrichota bacterium]